MVNYDNAPYYDITPYRTIIVTCITDIIGMHMMLLQGFGKQHITYK